MIELLLPSGKFARVRPIKVRDYLAVRRELKGLADDADIVVCYLVRIATIDDESLTYDQWLEMDMHDFSKVKQSIGAVINGPILKSDGR